MILVQRVARVLLPPVILAGLALAAWLTGQKEAAEAKAIKDAAKLPPPKPG